MEVARRPGKKREKTISEVLRICLLIIYVVYLFSRNSYDMMFPIPLLSLHISKEDSYVLSYFSLQSRVVHKMFCGPAEIACLADDENDEDQVDWGGLVDGAVIRLLIMWAPHATSPISQCS